MLLVGGISLSRDIPLLYGQHLEVQEGAQSFN